MSQDQGEQTIPVCRADRGDSYADCDQIAPHVWVGTSDRDQADTIVVGYGHGGATVYRRVVHTSGHRYEAGELTPEVWQRIFEETAAAQRAVDEAIADAIRVIKRGIRGPGRPPVYTEPRGRVNSTLPVDLIAAIEASGETITAYIEQAVRLRVEREMAGERHE